MWLIKPPEYTIPVLVVHPEHISDRLREGWRECADPTASPPPIAEPVVTDAPLAPTLPDGRTGRGDIPLHATQAVRHPVKSKGRR